MSRIQNVVTAYLRAKDHNRPHLMRQAFAPDARLEMVVNAGTISFPPLAQGIEAITEVLVRQFSRSFENVHTLCIGAPPTEDLPRYGCQWLVGMSEKDSRAVRVGCGRYDWVFESAPPRLASRLTITIEQMLSLAPEHLAPLMAWISNLSAPWCAASELTTGAPAIAELQTVIDYFA
ncbi:hypothetical protein GmRootV213_53460 (plasmid) [Variovorax sp. V213]|uniref:nuclear transport factor 2 family protein n=1 Tax=Variovorax sp. V213 TaxID=3065955 RepID=UPI0034E868D5